MESVDSKLVRLLQDELLALDSRLSRLSLDPLLAVELVDSFLGRLSMVGSESIDLDGSKPGACRPGYMARGMLLATDRSVRVTKSMVDCSVMG